MSGEMTLLTRKPRTASVLALEPTTILEQADRDRLLTEHPSVARGIMASLDPQRIAQEDSTAPKPSGKPVPAIAVAQAVHLLESDLIRELPLAADEDETQAATKQDLMSASEDAPIIKLANSILGPAIKQGGSDIHIEPMEGDVKETAKTAGEAALTGHLVFTALHTNNAAAAFTRLQEMDVEPFLVSSSTIGVIAQLARRLCQQCTEAYAVDASIARFWGLPEGITSDLKRYSAQLLTEGLTTVEEVTSVMSVDI